MGHIVTIDKDNRDLFKVTLAKDVTPKDAGLENIGWIAVPRENNHWSYYAMRTPEDLKILDRAAFNNPEDFVLTSAIREEIKKKVTPTLDIKDDLIILHDPCYNFAQDPNGCFNASKSTSISEDRHTIRLNPRDQIHLKALQDFFKLSYSKEPQYGLESQGVKIDALLETAQAVEKVVDYLSGNSAISDSPSIVMKELNTLQAVQDTFNQLKEKKIISESGALEQTQESTNLVFLFKKRSLEIIKGLDTSKDKIKETQQIIENFANDKNSPINHHKNWYDPFKTDAKNVVTQYLKGLKTQPNPNPQALDGKITDLSSHGSHPAKSVLASH